MSDFIINDSNFQQYVGETDGFRRGLVPRDLKAHPVGSYGNSLPFSDVMDVIPRVEWPDRCKDMAATKSRLSDILLKADNGRDPGYLDQGNQGFCWAYSTTMCVMAIRAVQGLPFKRLSPHGLACKIFNFQDRGAWAALSFEHATKIGIPDEDHWPLQSMDRRYDNAETWEAAKANIITEGFVDLDVSHVADSNLTFDQVATCYLNRIPVANDFNWWGHSTFMCDLVDLKPNLGQQGLNDPERWGNKGRNSWKDWGDNGWFTLQGSKAIPNGAVAPRQVVA